MVIELSEVQFGLDPYFVIMSMITDRVGLHEVLLPINYKSYSLQEVQPSYKRKRKFALKD